MYRTTNLPNTRIQVADALRGIAVAGIILIHSCEHFNLYWSGLSLDRAIIPALEKPVTDFMWWLFAGKMYTIFALLFGLSFYVQSDNQAQRGND
ncbi:MAG: heparan-alpha-glucosaminide N-acetyltransferase domain-containing protein, partial [Bacteroidales bacterium]|nr:heparan-alpha-glucosaminide N-acetyltransferase domain-containing protein [Bacteroidales bacterium]